MSEIPNSFANPVIKFPADDKHGLFTPFMKKFFFEERDYDVDESIFYKPGEEVRPNTIELVKKFLEQVRKKNPYDIDCMPPRMLGSPFSPLQASYIDTIRNHPDEAPQRFYAHMVQEAECAVNKINADTGHSYKLVKIEKAVYTLALVIFFTLTVKEDGVDAPVQTFQAAVYIPPGKDPIVNEWKAAAAATSTSGGA